MASATQSWNEAVAQLDRAADILGLEDGLREMLRRPRRAIEVAVPIRLDGGELLTIDGYRVQHNLTRGPGKGGLRIHHAATLAETKALAMAMSWKCALAGLPFGGAKGSLRCDVEALSEKERERMIRRFTSEIAPLIGPHLDVMAPDLNTGEQEMAWIMDTYSTGIGYRVPTVVTGKPVSLGGSAFRVGATGIGVARALTLALRDFSIATPVDVVVAGFGRLGQWFAREFADSSAIRIVGISDISGGRYSEGGLDLGAVLPEIEAGARVSDLGHGVAISREEVLELPCSVLVPAAIGGVITAENAERIRARIIVEGANGPTTSPAELILRDRGVEVVPDIVANCGGVLASHMEWMQDAQGGGWTAQEMRARLERSLDHVWASVRAFAGTKELELRDAAVALGVQRVADAHLARGLYP